MIRKQLLICVLSLFAFVVQAQSNFGLSRYKLGSGDEIKIVVFGQDDLTVQTRLPVVGTISYPFLGDIKVVGLTVSELENFIYSGLLGDYLVNPSVAVSIVAYRPFFIDGEVKKPGGYPYQPGLSVDKAAALAGGYTERASRNKIFISREVKGEQKRMTAFTTDVVQPGDIVTVEQSFF